MPGPGSALSCALTAGRCPLPHHAYPPQHGFREVDRSGMVYNPLTNAWWLSESDLRTNYILAARKTT